MLGFTVFLLVVLEFVLTCRNFKVNSILSRPALKRFFYSRVTAVLSVNLSQYPSEASALRVVGTHLRPVFVWNPGSTSWACFLLIVGKLQTVFRHTHTHVSIQPKTEQCPSSDLWSPLGAALYSLALYILNATIGGLPSPSLPPQPWELRGSVPAPHVAAWEPTSLMSSGTTGPISPLPLSQSSVSYATCCPASENHYFKHFVQLSSYLKLECKFNSYYSIMSRSSRPA